MELKQYWTIIKKKLWLIILCVILATTAAGVISIFFTTPIYQASTKIIVNQSKNLEQANPSVALNSIYLDVQLIETYKLIIRTPVIMNKVAERYPELNATGKELIRMVAVSNVKDTQVMTITATHTSYEQAAHVVNAVAKIFQQEIPNIMTVDNVAILNEAIPSESAAPISPNPILNMMIAFVVSLMAGLGFIFLLDYLDDTIKNEEDIHDVLDLPTLTVIVKMKKEDLHPKKSARSDRKLGDTAYVAVNK